MKLFRTLAAFLGIIFSITFYVTRNYLITEVSPILPDYAVWLVVLGGIGTSVFAIYSSTGRNSGLEQTSSTTAGVFAGILLLALLHSLTSDFKQALSTCSHLDLMNWTENEESRTDFDRELEFSGTGTFSGAVDVDSCKGWMLTAGVTYISLFCLCLAETMVAINGKSMQHEDSDDSIEAEFDDMDF